MAPTRNSHYNPCFWTAFWSQTYYQAALSGTTSLRAREQVVYFLNVKSDTIYETKTEDAHYEKDLGLSEITYDAALDFCKRAHPEMYEDFRRNAKESDYPVYLDCEDILSTLEATPSYKAIPDVIKRQTIIS